jgi:outer membrane protein assembly factor BamB
LLIVTLGGIAVSFGPWPHRSSLPATEPATFGGNAASAFQANPAHTGEQPGPGPTGLPRLLWRQQVGGSVGSTPAVVGGSVFLTVWESLARPIVTLVALEAATGAERWRAALGPGGADWLSSPAIANGMVVVSGADGFVHAFDAATGAERWRTRTVADGYSSPAIVAGTIYVGGGDGDVYALDVASGAVRWRFPTDGFLRSSPAVAGGTVYVASTSFYAVDAATGAERWRVAGAGGYASPAVAGDTVFAAGNDGVLRALDRATGGLRWQVALGTMCSPAVAGGTVYIGTTDRIGNHLSPFFALDAASGAERWRFVLTDETQGCMGAAITDGIVYAGGGFPMGTIIGGTSGGFGKLTALDAATGRPLWHVSLGKSEQDLGAAIVGGVLYIGSADGTVSAYGDETGPGTPAATPGPPGTPTA